MMVKNLVASISFYYNLIASTAFYEDRLTWCVQKNKPIQTSEILFHLCTDPIVYAVFTVQAIFVVFVGYLVQMFEQQPKWDVLRISVNGIACYLGLPCNYYPKGNASRLGSTFIFLGGMYFAILLNTIVIKIYTSPIFHPQVKTINHLIENEVSFVGNSFTYQEIMEENQVFILTIIQSVN